jgi:hypothetical protein
MQNNEPNFIISDFLNQNEIPDSMKEIELIKIRDFLAKFLMFSGDYQENKAKELLLQRQTIKQKQDIELRKIAYQHAERILTNMETIQPIEKIMRNAELIFIYINSGERKTMIP